MVLWIIIVAMAVALATELISFIGMVVVTHSAVRRMTAIKQELAEKLQPSILLTKEIRQSLQPDYEKLLDDSRGIIIIGSGRCRAMRAAWQDASRRTERLRLRFNRESVPTIERLQRERGEVNRGIVEPIRKISTVAMGVRGAAWLLRKVA